MGEIGARSQATARCAPQFVRNDFVEATHSLVSRSLLLYRGTKLAYKDFAANVANGIRLEAPTGLDPDA